MVCCYMIFDINLVQRTINFQEAEWQVTAISLLKVDSAM